MRLNLRWGLCLPGDASHDMFRGSTTARNRIYFSGGIGRPTTQYVWARSPNTQTRDSYSVVDDDDDSDDDDDDDDNCCGDVARSKL